MNEQILEVDNNANAYFPKLYTLSRLFYYTLNYIFQRHVFHVSCFSVHKTANICCISYFKNSELAEIIYGMTVRTEWKRETQTSHKPKYYFSSVVPRTLEMSTNGGTDKLAHC